jgi:transposase-like protein
MRTGRPSKYKPEYCEQLIEHMEQGLSFEAFAGSIGVCKQTLYTWTEEHEEFLDAKKRATEKSRLFWEKMGIDNIINVSEFKGDSTSLNSAVWVFNMKNRFGWRDKQPDEHDVVVNNFAKLSDEELDKEIEKLDSEIMKDDG